MPKKHYSSVEKTFTDSDGNRARITVSYGAVKQQDDQDWYPTLGMDIAAFPKDGETIQAFVERSGFQYKYDELARDSEKKHELDQNIAAHGIVVVQHSFGNETLQMESVKGSVAKYGDLTMRRLQQAPRNLSSELACHIVDYLNEHATAEAAYKVHAEQTNDARRNKREGGAASRGQN